MKALVTGATGFIGSALVKALAGKGYEVACLARKTSSLRYLEDLDVHIVSGDCTDKDSLRHLPSGFRYVFHLAGLTKANTEKEFFLSNETGTENLLSVLSAGRQPLTRFLYVSSLAAAGPSRDGTPLDESAPPRPVSFYGKSKLAGEQAVCAYGDRIPVTIIRPSAVYGPRDRDFFLFFKMVKRGFYPYWGKCYYSLLYVDDLVRGLIEAAEAPEAAGNTYFFSDGVYSNEDIVHAISQALETKAVRLRIPVALMGIVAHVSEMLSYESTIINRDKVREIKHGHWTCSAKKAEDELGFVPRVGLPEGMKWTADWYRIHKWM